MLLQSAESLQVKITVPFHQSSSIPVLSASYPDIRLRDLASHQMRREPTGHIRTKSALQNFWSVLQPGDPTIRTKTQRGPVQTLRPPTSRRMDSEQEDRVAWTRLESRWQLNQGCPHKTGQRKTPSRTTSPPVDRRSAEGCANTLSRRDLGQSIR